MQIAMLHYHLNPGGVTQVIANHLRALAAVEDPRVERVVLLHGGRAEGWEMPLGRSLGESVRPDVEVVAVPGLDYDLGAPDVDGLHAAVSAALGSQGLFPGQTVVHIHNHALGKNVSLPGVVHHLARDGYALLLQIHDFAEDYRPDNYRRLVRANSGTTAGGTLPERLYPQAPAIHYAVLNGRDRGVLATAGVEAGRLHVLPNPVSLPSAGVEKSVARAALEQRLGVPRHRSYVVYPVRGIRRKNLGEALLWAAWQGENTTYGITLAPKNPQEKPSYRHWKQVAGTHRLPFLFDVGGAGGLSFAENLAASDRLMTTSVAEGFGMVFLEAWLADRLLTGRDLPAITADFVAAGLQLDCLARQLRVPMDWVGRDDLRQHWTELFTETVAAFGLTAEFASQGLAAMEHTLDQPLVDFAQLTPVQQETVIGRVARSLPARETLNVQNPTLAIDWAGRSAEVAQRVASNRAVVESTYALRQVGQRLQQLYQTVLASPAGKPIQAPPRADQILRRLLDPTQLHPLRLLP